MSGQEPESDTAEGGPEEGRAESQAEGQAKDRTNMEKISREALGLRTQEEALRERVRADMDAPSSPLSEFRDLVRKGERQPGVIDRFVHGKRPEFQPQEDGRTQVQQLMRYARTLKENISRAYESLTYAGWDPADGDPDEMDQAAQSAITDNAEDHMLEAPPPTTRRWGSDTRRPASTRYGRESGRTPMPNAGAGTSRRRRSYWMRGTGKRTTTGKPASCRSGWTPEYSPRRRSP